MTHDLLHITLLIVGSKNSFREAFKGYLEDFQTVLDTSSAKGAIRLVRENNAIGVVIVDLSHPLDMDSSEFLKEIKLAGYPEVIFCQDYAFSPKIVPSLVQLVKCGAYDIIQLPSFREEIHWVLTKALGYYQLKLNIAESSAEHTLPVKTQLFLDLLLKRQNKGLAVSAQEIELIFPSEEGHDLPIETILEKVSKTPKEFKDVVVLIADDEPHYRSTISSILSPQKYQILEAPSGSEAMDMLKKEHVDVLLLDVALGDSLGPELLPIIKQKYPNIEIIMLTAIVDSEVIMSTIKNGAFDYVIKGSPQALIPQKIVHALQKKYFEKVLHSYFKDQGLRKA